MTVWLISSKSLLPGSLALQKCFEQSFDHFTNFKFSQEFIITPSYNFAHNTLFLSLYELCCLKFTYQSYMHACICTHTCLNTHIHRSNLLGFTYTQFVLSFLITFSVKKIFYFSYLKGQA